MRQSKRQRRLLARYLSTATSSRVLPAPTTRSRRDGITCGKHPEIVALPDPIAEQPAPEPVEDLDIDERDPDQRVSEIRRPRFRPGDKVRVTKPALRGITGEIKQYYVPTENYLLLVDGAPDLMWVSEGIWRRSDVRRMRARPALTFLPTV